MPGIYGSVPFIIGSPSTPKPVHSGPCEKCGVSAYRQTYSAVTKRWRWEHDACAPKVMIERSRTRTGAAQSYVPPNYERSTQFDPALAQTLHKQRRD